MPSSSFLFVSSSIPTGCHLHSGFRSSSVLGFVGAEGREVHNAAKVDEARAE
jgi:hypothetical protein